MKVLEIQDVVKKYHNHLANDKVKFDVEQGKLFGLLGPNGAGKTTLIRIITHITLADEGQVLLNGKKVGEWVTKHIGYMPEERGLYKKMKVADQLLYLAQLRGMSRPEAVKEIKHWFDKFEIGSWEKKAIEELSKGMQQKIQFIATVLHKPSLLILDEPFSGLDPVNSKLIEEEIINLKNQGASILFSTHRMEQVEEICEEIVLINKGKTVLEGDVNSIKHSYKDNKYVIKYLGDSVSIDSFRDKIHVIQNEPGHLSYQITNGTNPNHIIQNILNGPQTIIEYKELLPSLSDIFIKKVQEA
jgi:ABC-2 type transport system ATP-binding protein